jgi:methyl-accepting chemotaxis protein
MIATLYNLLKNTKIKSRLFFTLILLSIPLFCLLFLTVITQNRAIRFGEKEIAGVAYNRLLIDLIKDYRNAIATLSINTVQPNYFELESTISSIERTEKYLVPLNSEHEDSLDTKESFNKLITEQEIFKKSVFSRNAIEAKKSAFKILEIVSKLNSSVGDTSNLILDPDLDSYYLMDITLIKIPLLMEVSTQIESILFQAIQENNLSEENQIKLFNFYSQFNTALDQTLNSFSVAYKYNEKVKNKIEPKVNIALENINRYRDELKILSNPSNKTIDMEKILKFPSQLKNYNESILDLYLVTSDSQNELLDIRVSDFKFEQFLSISLVLLITGLTIFIQFVIVFSITNPLSEAVTKFELLAKGNLKHRIEYIAVDGRKKRIVNFTESFGIAILRTLYKRLEFVGRQRRSGHAEQYYNKIKDAKQARTLRNVVLQQAQCTGYSHSIVAGGLLVRSKNTASMPLSFIMRSVMTRSALAGNGTAFAVMASCEAMGRSTIDCPPGFSPTGNSTTGNCQMLSYNPAACISSVYFP